MKNLYSLKVYPNGSEREVYRKIEITGDATLDDLCGTIIASFDFIDEHLYEFCMDNQTYSDCSYQSDPEIGEPLTKIRLDKLGLNEKQTFLLHYDFGDDWLFFINVEKISQTEKTILPHVTKRKGDIEQYPDTDDLDRGDE